MANPTPYRTDREALEERLQGLRAELAAAREAVEDLGAARERAARLEREVAEVAARLARAPVRSLLDNIRIAAPCSADWGQMRGDARVRFCGSCEKNVYDLSQMTRPEAEALFAGGESPCVRLFRRHDGTVITSDCPVGVRRRRLKRVVASAVGGAILAGAMLLRWRASGAGCTMGKQAVAGGAMVAPPTTAAPMGTGFAEPPPAPAVSGGAELGEPVRARPTVGRGR